jgi:hypothetical protein
MVSSRCDSRRELGRSYANDLRFDTTLLQKHVLRKYQNACLTCVAVLITSKQCSSVESRNFIDNVDARVYCFFRGASESCCLLNGAQD